MSEKESSSLEMSNNEKLVTIEFTSRVYSGQYRELFEEAATVLGDKATVFDYHLLYGWCLNFITFDLCANIGFLEKVGIERTSSYNKEISRYKKLRRELDAVFYEFAIKIENPNYEILERLEKKLDKITADQNNDLKQLPELESLNELTKGKVPILRKWQNGKYKCASLPKFIKAYIKKMDNLTPALIRDYLISDRTGKPYSKDTIEKDLTLHGPGRI